MVRVQASLFPTSFTNNALVSRQALASQTDTCTSLFQQIPRQSCFFDLAVDSSGPREEIQAENSPRSSKEVESACIRNVQTCKYSIIFLFLIQPN